MTPLVPSSKQIPVCESIPPRQLPYLRTSLLNWFDRHARDLPWRRTRDPYAIWISEVMLQQTQVATVVPYFERFLAAFPDVPALAAASEQDVLRLWEGLGYYRRARSLHEAARQIQSNHGGVFPSDAQDLSQLPGLGRYTVNAVLSQAFDQRLPILEANSRRVLCRILGIEDDPAQAAVQNRLWQAAETLLPSQRVGHFNQALMEVGALVCTPARPACDTCPLTKYCVARAKNLQDVIPRRSPPPRIETVEETALVLWRHDRVLLVKRPPSGRWANMWEFPHVPLQSGESHGQAALHLLEALGMHGRMGGEIARIQHSVTRFRITLVCLTGTFVSGRFTSKLYPRGKFVPPKALDDYPVSVPQRRLARIVAERARSSGG